jgi:hypothetical protein
VEVEVEVEVEVVGGARAVVAARRLLESEITHLMHFLQHRFGRCC